MPTATNRIQELREQSHENDIPYLSKSRVKSWKTCPRKFYHTYVEGKRAEETDAMRQGTRVHLTFEIYYNNLIEFYSIDDNKSIRPTFELLSTFLPDDALIWADWQNFVSNFLVWEIERFETSISFIEEIVEREGANLLEKEIIESSIEEWLPVGIEEEAWSDDNEPPWMGFADVIVSASSVKEIDSNDGVVIVDFKTGKTPDKKYRDSGIFLEGEYYAMIFADEYDVAGVAGMYPKNGDFLVSSLSDKREKTVEQVIQEINEAIGPNGEEPNREDFPFDPQPLCKWGEGEENECDFYGECPSNWGEPAKNKEVFVEMVERGDNNNQIAQFFDVDYGCVNYWKFKFNL